MKHDAHGAVHNGMPIWFGAYHNVYGNRTHNPHSCPCLKNMAPKEVKALVEVVADGEGGKSKVRMSNLKFWKRQACVSTPKYGHVNDTGRVDQKRKIAQAGGDKRSGKKKN